MNVKSIRFRELLVMGVVLGVILAGAWYVVGGSSAATATVRAPANLPPEIAKLLERLKPEAREAYAYALERPDVLQYMPCYCGCDEAGHTSNASCFVKRTADGGFTLDSHGST